MMLPDDKLTPDELEQIEEIFSQALDNKSAERAEFVRNACHGNERVCTRVLQLLESNDNSPPLSLDIDLIIKEHTSDQGDTMLIGHKICGRYIVKKLLGRGAMGDVYLAHDERLRRDVAVKILPPLFINNEERICRFHTEAVAASNLNHPNILAIFDHGEYHEEGPATYFIAMEFIEGQNLRERMGSKHVSVEETLKIAVQIAEGLFVAHGVGIVHRDIKPENIMVAHDHVKILDFGIAKITGKLFDRLNSDSPTQERLIVGTKPWQVFGTRFYMSPEQINGDPIDNRTDLWSLGVVLYELFTGHVPFNGNSPEEAAEKILKVDPKPFKIKAPKSVSKEVNRIVFKCLAKDKAGRYESAAELKQDLTAVQQKIIILNANNKYFRYAACVMAGLIALGLVAYLIYPRPKRIRICGIRFTEHQLVSEMIAQVLEDQGLKVERVFNESSILCREAFKNGTIDGYVEYTGNIYTELLHKRGPYPNKDDIYNTIKHELPQRGIDVSEKLGFSSDWAILVRKEDAEYYRLTNISDIESCCARFWKLGYVPDFNKETLNKTDFINTYGLHFESDSSNPLERIYKHLEDGDLDVIVGNSNDDISQDISKFQPLVDDKHYFPPYEVVFLTRHETTEQISELQKAIDQLNSKLKNEGRITTDEMKQKIRVYEGFPKEKRDDQTFLTSFVYSWKENKFGRR